MQADTKLWISWYALNGGKFLFVVSMVGALIGYKFTLLGEPGAYLILFASVVGVCVGFGLVIGSAMLDQSVKQQEKQSSSTLKP